MEAVAGGTCGLLDQPVDDKLNTPLHAAIANGFWEGAMVLVERGARCNLRNVRGDSPLQLFGWPRLGWAAIACRLAARPDGPQASSLVRRVIRPALAANLGLTPPAAMARPRLSPPIASKSSAWTLGTLGWSLGSGRFRGVDFRLYFGLTWLRDPFRSTGLVSQHRLHQRSAPHTIS